MKSKLGAEDLRQLDSKLSKVMKADGAWGLRGLYEAGFLTKMLVMSLHGYMGCPSLRPKVHILLHIEHDKGCSGNRI